MSFVFENRFVFEDEKPKKSTAQIYNVDPLGGGLSGFSNIPGMAKSGLDILSSLAVGAVAWPASKIAKYATMINEGLVKEGAPTLEQKIAADVQGKPEPSINADEILAKAKAAENAISQIPAIWAKGSPKAELAMKVIGYPFELIDKGVSKVVSQTGMSSLAKEITKDALETTMFMAGPEVIKGIIKKSPVKIGEVKSPGEMAKTPESIFLREKFKERYVDDFTGKPINLEKESAKVAKEAPSKKAEPKKTIIQKNPYDFKSTEKALEFGSTAADKQIADLKQLSQKSDEIVNRLKSEKKFQEAMDEATRGQFYREAIRASKEKELAKKRPVIKGLEKSIGTTLYGGIPAREFIKFGSLWTKHIGEPIWDKGVMQKIPNLLEKIPGGKTINRALIYDYRGNLPETPKYIKSLDDVRMHQARGKEYAIDIGKRLQVFDEPTQIKIGEVIRGELSPEKLTGEAKKQATEASWAMLELGKQAVDAGLLSEETFFKNAGRYMPRLYSSKEYKALMAKWNFTKPNRLDLSRFKKRADIPKEIRKEMGEILTPGYPIAKGITQLTHDIELARFFNGIAQNPAWSISKKSKIPIPDGWKKIEGEKLGKLNGSYVHPEIFKDLQEAIKVINTPERIWRRSLGYWKFGKVILSPKTHARNLMSNSILAHLGGLPMYEQPAYLIKAAKEMRTKGNIWKAAKEYGLLSDTFTNAELKTLFDQVNSSMHGIKASSIPDAMGKIGNAWGKTKAAGRGAAKIYELEEQWFKMAKMIHNIEKRGLSSTAAAADAEKWLFNYRKITKFQEKYRNKWYGAPFATFTFKALPRVTEAAIKTPWRFALPASIIYGLEKAASNVIGDTKEQEIAKKKLRPKWMRNKSFIDMLIPRFARVPFVDQYGREHYLNLTYILPWGDITEGGEFMGIPGSLRPISQPFVNELAQQIGNYDFFWKGNIVPERELAGKTKTQKFITQAKLRGGHAVKTFAPTPVIDIMKAYSTIKGEPDYRGRERAKGIVAFDVLAGVKIYPVDYSEQLVRQISKIDPQKGSIAREIHNQIKTYSIKRAAWEKKGKNTRFYDKLIDKKIQQLKGMAKEVARLGELSKKIRRQSNAQYIYQKK